MILKSLKIKNFRAIKELKVDFIPGINIIIGKSDNAIPTLVDAIVYSLSFIFSSKRALGEDFLSAGDPTLNIKSFSESDYHYGVEGPRRVYVSIAAEALYGDEALKWELYQGKAANAALHTSKYKAAFIKFMHLWKIQGLPLPLLSYYSDTFPSISTKPNSFAIRSIRKDRIPRNFGYYQWDLKNSSTSIWEIRLCNVIMQRISFYSKVYYIEIAMRELEEKFTIEKFKDVPEYLDLKSQKENTSVIWKPVDEEFNFIFGKLSLFSTILPKLDEEEYIIKELVLQENGMDLDLAIVFKNGSVKRFYQLPGFHHRLYSIVLDLAYRSWVLNGLKESPGTVIIDGIDIHLDSNALPKVINCFQKVFPHTQFIFTMHSPTLVENSDKETNTHCYNYIWAP